MLATLNIWADVLAVVIITLGILFFVFQIVGTFVTGRFMDRFRGKQWPKHKEIIPPIPKILHGALAFSIISLFISGLYLRFPFYDDGYITMRQSHYLFIFPVVFAFVLRVYYAINKDAEEFSIRPRELRDTVKVMMYHAFVRSRYAQDTKYNIFQKLMYGVLFPVLTIVSILSGFALLWPDVLLGWFAGLFGGLSMTIALVVIIHWITAVSIISLALVHACLTFVEDFPTLMIFIGLAEQPRPYEYEKINEQV